MQTILVIRTGLTDTWQEELAGIIAYARSVNWSIQFVDARARRPDIPKLIEFWKPAGAIIDASWIPQKLEAHLGKIPFVLSHPRNQRNFETHSCIIGNQNDIAQLAAKELFSRSLQSVAFIEWQEKAYWATTKREAFRKIVKMYGLDLNVITPAPQETANPVLRRKQLAKALSGLPRPCGVFAIYDAIGALAISALSHLGYRIPQDYSIVSVDDDVSICESCSPTLSSIRPNYYQIGFSAGNLLFQLITHPRASRQVVMIPPAGIVRRASSLITNRADSAVVRALDYIRVNACSGLTPKDLLNFFGNASVRSAELRFRAVTGKSIAAEILDIRLSRACDYLRTTSTSVQAIANFCGWNSPIAFRKAFRSRFGMSPRDWTARNSKRSVDLP